MKNSKNFSTIALAIGLMVGGGFTVSAEKVVTVEAGDTFWNIAQESGIDINKLVKDNAQFSPTALPIGAKVEVNVKDAVHFVEQGDTLSKIATIHDVTVNTLFAYNAGINPFTLMPGDGVVFGPGEDGVVNAMESRSMSEMKQTMNSPEGQKMMNGMMNMMKSGNMSEMKQMMNSPEGQEMMNGMMNMMESGNMSEMMQMMDSPKGQEMMNGMMQMMNSPKGQEMMNAYKDIMASAADDKEVK